MNYFWIIARYIPLQIIATLTVLLTWLLAPLLALCYTRDTNWREWLIKPLRWFQTFDNPVDEWRLGGYYKKCKWVNWDFNRSTHRYLARVFWLYRNPAYGFAQALGITPKGNMRTIWDKGTWDSAKTNYHLTIWDNCFHYQAQLYWYKNHFLRINIGYKPHTGFAKYMIAGHFNPFRTWRK